VRRRAHLSTRSFRLNQSVPAGFPALRGLPDHAERRSTVLVTVPAGRTAGRP